MTTTPHVPATGPEPGRAQPPPSGPTAAPQTTVQVGPGPTNVLLRSTADAVLGLLFERHRAIFGALVAEAVTGEVMSLQRRAHRGAPKEGQ
jgi:hypothetical protein